MVHTKPYTLNSSVKYCGSQNANIGIALQSPQPPLPNSSLLIKYLWGCSQAASSAHSGRLALSKALYGDLLSQGCPWRSAQPLLLAVPPWPWCHSGRHRPGCNVFLCSWDVSLKDMTHFMPRHQRKHPNISTSCCLGGKGKRGTQL